MGNIFIYSISQFGIEIWEIRLNRSKLGVVKVREWAAFQRKRVEFEKEEIAIGERWKGLWKAESEISDLKLKGEKRKRKQSLQVKEDKTETDTINEVRRNIIVAPNVLPPLSCPSFYR